MLLFSFVAYAQVNVKSENTKFVGIGDSPIFSRIMRLTTLNIQSSDCNLLPSTVDGSFQSCISNVGRFNSNVTCSGWQNVTPTSPDTWSTPIPSATVLNSNMIPSPDGGIFAGAIARYSDMTNPGVPEAFNTSISNLIPGEQYQIKFYQSNMTNFISSNVVGSVRWEVTFGNEIQTSANSLVEMAPKWTEQNLLFTAISETQDLIFKALEGTIIGNYDYLYAVIDGIKVTRKNFDCNNPCNSITGTIVINPTIKIDCKADVIANPYSQTISTEQMTAINLTSTVAGTTFNWTVSQEGTTGAVAGSGNSINQILTNIGIDIGHVTYTITPTLNNCSGTPIIVVISVAPKSYNPSIKIDVAGTCRNAGDCRFSTYCGVNIPVTYLDAPEGSAISLTLYKELSNPPRISLNISRVGTSNVWLLSYIETGPYSSVDFTLYLRDANGNVLSKLDQTISRQPMWESVPPCN
ncbi:PKD-like domain-containing protein [Flavobacterium sp. 5]|uniref:PKD-like domain-containing protein n=1 Tax=Flavobacterium sp. 5 TaxID=2035199 RepID=UPI0012FD1C99|nr:PKD-like domain-containing protein [Flavobacterium sp. 5]